MSRWDKFIRCGFPVGLLLLLVVGNLFWGSVSLAPAEVFRILAGESRDAGIASFIVWQSRLPQMLTALLAGSALAVSGLVMQTVFANPLADPSILGVSSGASLGAAVAVLLCGGSYVAGTFVLSGYLLTVLFAFAGAWAVLLLLLFCAAALRHHLLLLVAGVMMSFAVSSVVALLNFFSTAEGVRSYVIWGMGDFSGVTLERLPLFSVLLLGGLLGVLCMSKPLNAILLGYDYAANLGINVRRVRLFLLLLTGFLTAVVTAVCGPVAFLGLAVPHVARLTLRTADHRLLLPLTGVWGGNMALLCNLLMHLPGERGLLPLNAVSSLLGIPVVLYILFRQRWY